MSILELITHLMILILVPSNRRETKMQGLGSYTDFMKEAIKDCNSINKIQNINKDKIGGRDSLEMDLLSEDDSHILFKNYVIKYKVIL